MSDKVNVEVRVRGQLTAVASDTVSSEAATEWALESLGNLSLERADADVEDVAVDALDITPEGSFSAVLDVLIRADRDANWSAIEHGLHQGCFHLAVPSSSEATQPFVLHQVATAFRVLDCR